MQVEVKHLLGNTQPIFCVFISTNEKASLFMSDERPLFVISKSNMIRYLVCNWKVCVTYAYGLAYRAGFCLQY